MARIVAAPGNEDMAAAWDGHEGEHWAEHAERYEAGGVRYREVLLEAADLDPYSAVLDVGCGSGASTIAAGRIAARGSALGVDLSSRMLAVGRAAAAAAGLDHVRFEQADAQIHPFDAGVHDVAMSAFGSMFFADPVAAFSNIRRSLRAGGSLVLLAWRDLDRNVWVSSVRTALAAGRDLPAPPPGVPSPFSLADRDLTTERLRAAGYEQIAFTSVDESMSFGPNADDAYAFVSTTGIARGLTADLDDATRVDAFERLRQVLADHETPDGVLLPASAWLITATNPNGAS
jgi:SAM-dependent methyltransferase